MATKKGGIGYGQRPRERLSLALFSINFLNFDAQGRSAAHRHEDTHSPSKGLVKWKGILTGLCRGPDPVLVWAQGSVFVFPLDQQDPVWVQELLTRKVQHEERPAQDNDELPTFPHDDNPAGKMEPRWGIFVGVPKANASDV